MRSSTDKIEPFRIVGHSQFATERSSGMNGAFFIPLDGAILNVIASDGSDWNELGLPGNPWEHVSVSLRVRTPTWAEMDYVKRLFWETHETVIQFHVPRLHHKNTNEFTLHMWRQIGVEVPLPPIKCV